jgi:hypothetical protein
MEYFYTNSAAWLIIPEFQEANDITWGSFNVKNANLSPEAWDLKDVKRYPRVLGHLGLHSQDDWAFSLTWYHQDEHWRAFIPKIEGNYDKEWFGLGQQFLNITEMSSDEISVSIPDDWITECKSELTTALNCRELRDSK